MILQKISQKTQLVVAVVHLKEDLVPPQKAISVSFLKIK